MIRQTQNRISQKQSFITPQSYFLIGQGQSLVGLESLAASRFAAARFPLKQENSPRHADALIVAGPINRRYRPVVARLAAQLAWPGQVVYLNNPPILPGPALAAYCETPEMKGDFRAEKQTPVGFVTGPAPIELISVLHNAFSLPSTSLGESETGPGTLVSLRSYEEKELATEDLTLSLGPAHPAIYGPLRLVLTLDGEQVAVAEADPGYAHRGLEKLTEGRELSSAPAFGAALDALAPLSGTLAVTLALEKMAGSQPLPLQAGFLRLVVLELERVASHLFTQARLLKILALDGPAHKTLDLYAEVAASLRLVGGEPAWRFIVPGGVQSDLSSKAITSLNSLVRQIQAWVRQALGPASFSLSNKIIRYSLQSRLAGLGAISSEEAVELGFSGPNLRASGNSFDWRAARSLAGSGLPYRELGFKPTLLKSSQGDAYSRYRLRIEEIAASATLVELALKNLPGGTIQVELDLDSAFLPSNLERGNPGPEEASGMVESPRGLLEASLALTLNQAGQPVIDRLHFRSPSWPHFQAVPRLITGARLPDALAIINSLDIAPDEAER